MVNKDYLSEMLTKELNKTKEETLLILKIIEESNYKYESIEKIKNSFSITTDDATIIYEKTKKNIKKLLVERIKHPFKKY